MDIQGLGYVGIRAKSLEDWKSFGTQFLGMQLVERSGKSLALRMDDRKQRVLVSEDGGEGVAFFGWEVVDAAALDDFAARLEQAGVEVARGSRALADERRVKDLVVLADPLGNRLEIFHGAETASAPFKPGRSISGFRTGPLGMGHAVLHVKDINDEVTSFYSNSPSGFMVEYGWGGRIIDVDGWQPEEVTWGPSMWGHDRLWMTPEKRAEARAIRIEAAASGLRKPVNVIEGNYKLAPGVCPWWDGVVRGEAAE